MLVPGRVAIRAPNGGRLTDCIHEAQKWRVPCLIPTSTLGKSFSSMTNRINPLLFAFVDPDLPVSLRIVPSQRCCQIYLERAPSHWQLQRL
jgi:hypothetical protein